MCHFCVCTPSHSPALVPAGTLTLGLIPLWPRTVWRMQGAIYDNRPMKHGWDYCLWKFYGLNMSKLSVSYYYKPYCTLVSTNGNVSLRFSRLTQTEKCQQLCELLPSNLVLISMVPRRWIHPSLKVWLFIYRHLQVKIFLWKWFTSAFCASITSASVALALIWLQPGLFFHLKTTEV